MAITDGADERQVPISGGDESRSRVVGWSIAGGLVILLVVGIVAAVVREPAALDPETPEGAVQGYLQAVFDGDWAAARGFLDDATSRRCSTAEFRQAWVPSPMTASWDLTRSDGDDAEVDVQLRLVRPPDPLGGGNWVQAETFELVRVDDAWRITGRPWPVYACRGW